jgi:hypothetical protein
MASAIGVSVPIRKPGVGLSTSLRGRMPEAIPSGAGIVSRVVPTGVEFHSSQLQIPASLFLHMQLNAYGPVTPPLAFAFLLPYDPSLLGTSAVNRCSICQMCALHDGE